MATGPRGRRAKGNSQKGKPKKVGAMKNTEDGDEQELDDGFETGWGLTKKIDVLTLKHKVKLDDPMLLTGASCCDQFSALRNLRKEMTA